jgi:hypothetical protein
VTRHRLEIRPLSRHHWVVRYEGDVTPLSEHTTLTAARREAINHALQFGEPTIHVYELDGEEHEEYLDPDFKTPTRRDVRGPHIEP